MRKLGKGLLGSLGRAVGRLFGGKPKPASSPAIKPPPPTKLERIYLRGPGHGGQALGSRKPGKQDLSPENIAKWKQTHSDEVQDFVYGREPIYVHSTNVVAAQYNDDLKKLAVKFKGKGQAYMYHDCDERMAFDFAQDWSKGGWVWENLRILGTKNGHKKTFTRCDFPAWPKFNPARGPVDMIVEE